MLAAILRTAFFYLLVIVALRFLGKRQIGELEPCELVLAMLISDLASAPMQDQSLPLWSGIVPIFTILSLSLLFSWCAMKNIYIRRLLCGNPTMIIKDGTLQQDAMRRCRLTLDELFEELRSQGVTDLTTVKYAVLETNGQLSVLLYASEAPATPRQLGRTAKDDVHPATLLISGGSILYDNLKRLGLTRAWLDGELARRGCESHKAVFLFSIDTAGNILFVKKDRFTSRG